MRGRGIPFFDIPISALPPSGHPPGARRHHSFPNHRETSAPAHGPPVRRVDPFRFEGEKGPDTPSRCRRIAGTEGQTGPPAREEGGEEIADDGGASGDEDRDRARGMARRGDDPAPDPEDREIGGALDDDVGLDASCLPRHKPDLVRDDPGEREPSGNPTAHGAGVGRMDGDWCAGPVPEHVGAPVMVRVAVGNQDQREIIGADVRTPHCGQNGRFISGVAGIDQEHPPIPDDERCGRAERHGDDRREGTGVDAPSPAHRSPDSLHTRICGRHDIPPP